MLQLVYGIREALPDSITRQDDRLDVRGQVLEADEEILVDHILEKLCQQVRHLVLQPLKTYTADQESQFSTQEQNGRLSSDPL